MNLTRSPVPGPPGQEIVASSPAQGEPATPFTTYDPANAVEVVVGRMTGSVSSGIGEIELLPGSHMCAFYRGGSDRDRLLSAYLDAGLTAGDKCICVVDSAVTARQLELLPRPGGRPARPDGQLNVHLPESTYLAGGGFSAGEMLTFWAESMAKAEADGYSFCRLAGEMTWPLRDVPGVEHLVQYESELNRVTSSCPVIVLCLYDLDRFSGEVVVNIVKTHPQVLIHGILVENPYYIRPDEFDAYALA